MIISTKLGTPKEELEKLVGSFEGQGIRVSVITGTDYTVIGLVGDTTRLDETCIRANPYVDNVQRVSEPDKLANRLFHHEDSVISVRGIPVGGKEKLAVIGGPCSVEGKEQIVEVAKSVKAAGGHMLRGGAYKPRTSPYAFQGLGTEGILDLVEARKVTGLPIVSELMRTRSTNLRNMWIWSRSARGICKTSSSLRRWAKCPSPSCSSGAWPIPSRSGS